MPDILGAADRIGRPGQTVTVPEEGPREVRQAAQAFNRMQARIDRLIADRTQALAAVSHDLRTPLARLRLRAGFLDDAEAQRQIDADLDEMDAADYQVLKDRFLDVLGITGNGLDGSSAAGAVVPVSAG